MRAESNLCLRAKRSREKGDPCRWRFWLGSVGLTWNPGQSLWQKYRRNDSIAYRAEGQVVSIPAARSTCPGLVRRQLKALTTAEQDLLQAVEALDAMNWGRFFSQGAIAKEFIALQGHSKKPGL